ncbi:MAG: InlB B-repeat-containing protein [Oscillospiraceae bacterium]|nr:InlB B-repeat-containing protein [Oscillospiraceae bacterium]
MKTFQKALALVLTLALVLGAAPVALADDPPPPQPLRLVEARLVTEVLDWGESVTAIRIEYDDEISCSAIEYSLEHANRMTYKMVSNRDIVNLYVNNSGRKDDVQLKGRYVFINLGIENEDFATYRDQIVFRGNRLEPDDLTLHLTQSLPITSVNGKVCGPSTFSTTTGQMTAEKDRVLPALTADLLGPDVIEVRTASTEVRTVLDDFRTFIYRNPARRTNTDPDDNNYYLKFHLYIPPGYDVAKASSDEDPLPLVAHYPNTGDSSLEDDMHIANGVLPAWPTTGSTVSNLKRHMGALMAHPEAVYWADAEAQERNPSFVLSIAGPTSGGYPGSPAFSIFSPPGGANWDRWYHQSPMQQDYIQVMHWIMDTFNVDTSRVVGMNLMDGATSLYATLIPRWDSVAKGGDDFPEVDIFSALVINGMDGYNTFANNTSLPGPLCAPPDEKPVVLFPPPTGADQVQLVPDKNFEEWLQYADEQITKIFDMTPMWLIGGHTDRTGPVYGDQTYVGQDIGDGFGGFFSGQAVGRIKGERMFDFAHRLNTAAGETVVVANDWNSMWNGLVNQNPTSNPALKGDATEKMAKAQWDAAKALGVNVIYSSVMPGTLPQTSHWVWNAANRNRVVQDWAFSQVKGTHEGFDRDVLDKVDYDVHLNAEGGGTVSYAGMSPRTPRVIPDNAPRLEGKAGIVEARLVTEVLDWGETVTAIRIEYAEEILCDAIEYSVEHANRQSYQLASDRDITNLYVNNSGKKDDYQPQGKYVFINLGLNSWDFTSYRDQVCFDTSLRIRPRINPYYVYQAFPVMTVEGNVIEPTRIVTEISPISGTLLTADGKWLPNIEQMDVWSTEVRTVIDEFRSFRYTNPADDSQTKFHLYIPQGYESRKASLEDIPLVVHFPSGDTAYVDDVLGNADASRQMGSLFTHADASIWASERAQAQQKAFVLTPGPNWNGNYMYIVKALAENLNIDIGRIYAISLAAGSTPMWNTILANPGVFAAYISTAYDPYHAFAGGTGDYADRAKNAEDKFEQLLEELPGWNFAGLTDGSGSPVTGDPQARLKGERWRDIGLLMNTEAHKIDVSWGQEGELMWNGMLRGKKAEAEAEAQLARAETAGADTLVTLFIPGTVLQTMHWSWMAAYTNAVTWEWLYSNVREDAVGTANIVAPTPAYIITFEPNNGTAATSSTTGPDGKLSSLPTPSRSNYRFGGWYTASNGGTPVTTSYVFDRDTVIYAQWAYVSGGSGIPVTGAPRSFTVAFNSTGGSAVSNQNVASGGKAVKPADPTREGYAFAGWYTDAAGTTAYNFNNAVTAGLTLYAKWTPSDGTGESPDDGTAGAPNETPFADAAGHWAYEDIKYAHDAGLMNGISANQFSPNVPTERGMIVTVLWRIEGSPVPEATSPFNDVAVDAYYTPAVTWAAENNVVNGISSGIFAPRRPVTREQVATILYRYAQYKQYNVSAQGDLTAFPDASAISEYADARASVTWAVGAGLLRGRSNGALDPQGTATRAELAALLHRFLLAFAPPADGEGAGAEQ